MSTRPGCGPITHGRFQPRHDELQQQAFHQGWKKNLGLKAQSLDSPDGLPGYLYGLESIRRNDVQLEQWSDVNNKLAVAQAHMPLDQQYHVYGDRIFVPRSHIRSKTGVAAVDSAMNGGRVCIEHHYGENGQYIPFMSMQSKIKLQSGMPLEALYFDVCFFRNCLTCLYGNKTSERMNCTPPTLTEWLSWPPAP